MTPTELKDALFELLDRKRDPNRFDHYIVDPHVSTKSISLERPGVAVYVITPEESGKFDLLIVYPSVNQSFSFDSLDELTTYMLQ